MDIKNLFQKKTDEEKFKLSEESATAEFNKILDCYDIDPEKDFTSDMKDAYEQLKMKIVKAIRTGRLNVKNDSDGMKLVQTLKNGTTTITYNEISATAKMAMASASKDDSFGKIYEVMGSLSNLGSSAITQLKGSDLILCESLGTLFLLF